MKSSYKVNFKSKTKIYGNISKYIVNEKSKKLINNNNKDTITNNNNLSTDPDNYIESRSQIFKGKKKTILERKNYVLPTF